MCAVKYIIYLTYMCGGILAMSVRLFQCLERTRYFLNHRRLYESTPYSTFPQKFKIYVADYLL